MEKALLDEGAVEQRFGLEVAGFECVLSGGSLLTAEAIEAPLNFGEPADVVGLGFAFRLVVFAKAGEESVEFFLAFAREDDGLGKDSVFQGVLEGGSFGRSAPLPSSVRGPVESCVFA